MTGYHNADCAFGCPHFDEPTPASDDRREALVRHFMQWFGGGDQPVIDDYLAADAAIAWFAARPSAPTVTTEQVRKVAIALADAIDGQGYHGAADTHALALAAIAALGIEVTP